MKQPSETLTTSVSCYLFTIAFYFTDFRRESFSASPPPRQLFSVSGTYFFWHLPRSGFLGDHREKFMRAVTQMKHSVWVSFFIPHPIAVFLSFLRLCFFFFVPLMLSFVFPFLSFPLHLQRAHRQKSHSVTACDVQIRSDQKHAEVFVLLQTHTHKKGFMYVKQTFSLMVFLIFHVWPSWQAGQIAARALWQK